MVPSVFCDKSCSATALVTNAPKTKVIEITNFLVHRINLFVNLVDICVTTTNYCIFNYNQKKSNLQIFSTKNYFF